MESRIRGDKTHSIEKSHKKAKETAAVVTPAQTTMFHATASACMSGDLACHRLQGISYLQLMETDHRWDEQRLKKLI